MSVFFREIQRRDLLLQVDPGFAPQLLDLQWQLKHGIAPQLRDLQYHVKPGFAPQLRAGPEHHPLSRNRFLHSPAQGC